MTTRQLLAFIFLAAVWGGSFLFMRVAVPEFGALPLILMRVFIGAVFLVTVVSLTGQLKAPQRHAMLKRWRDMLVVGGLGSALPFTLIAYALHSISSGMSAIINTMVPLFTAIVAYFWLGDRISPWRSLGIALGILGVLVLVWGKVSLNADGITVLLAVIAGLLATVSYGFSAVYMRVHTQDIDPMMAATFSMIAASVLLLPLSIAAWPAQSPSFTAWANTLVLGVVSTGMAYMVFFRLIRSWGPSKAVTVTFVVPIFASVWGLLFLGEEVSLQMLAGGIIIITGTGLAMGLVPIKKP